MRTSINQISVGFEQQEKSFDKNVKKRKIVTNVILRKSGLEMWPIGNVAQMSLERV